MRHQPCDNLVAAARRPSSRPPSPRSAGWRRASDRTPRPCGRPCTRKPEATPRCVTGIPASSGAATAVVTPGTTSNGMPAAVSASASSAPRPNTNGSPPLSRTTRLPCSARPHHQAIDGLLLDARAPGALADAEAARLGSASAARSASTSASYRTRSAAATRRNARIVHRSGSPGPAPTRDTKPAATCALLHLQPRTARHRRPHPDGFRSYNLFNVSSSCGRRCSIGTPSAATAAAPRLPPPSSYRDRLAAMRRAPRATARQAPAPGRSSKSQSSHRRAARPRRDTRSRAAGRPRRSRTTAALPPPRAPAG